MLISWRSTRSRAQKSRKGTSQPRWNLSAAGPELSFENAVTSKISKWAAETTFEQLDSPAVHGSKRFLLDSLGCALGALQQHDVQIALAVLGETAGRGPATVIGTGKRIDPVSATFLNALMIRCLDFNDIYWRQDPSHPSDLFPVALAAGERAQSDGRELIVGLVLGHEFEMRFCEVAYPGIEERGWHHATLTAFVSPIVAGRMLRLPWRQIQNAIGISACRHVTLGSVSAGELSMIKNTADPLASQSGMFAALLAEKGYTGPWHLIEGEEGLVHCLGPEWKLNRLTDALGESWRINQCGMKAFPTEALTHAPISATLDLVNAHDLTPENILKIEIHTLTRAAAILSDPSKYNPLTKETADHSLPFVIAVAIVDRRVTPASFTPEKIMNSRIREQLNKVHLVADPEIDRSFPALQRTIVKITARDGRVVIRQLDYPKGDPRNPLTDREIEGKFEMLSDGVLPGASQRRVKDAIWNLEKLKSVHTLLQLTKANGNFGSTQSKPRRTKIALS
jgi:2-methylcitrate dehydratase